jgi:acyl dehydratase
LTLNHDTVGTVFEPVPSTWTTKDCMIYALGVGAGTDDLQFTTENTQEVLLRVLPSMAVVLARLPRELFATVGIKLAGLVHGSQSFSVDGELPTSGSVLSTSTVRAIYDKGSIGVVVVATEASLPGSGTTLFRAETTLIARGQGGWGGERGPSSADSPAVDWSGAAAVESAIRSDQALLYRLSGDRNPLHSDPGFAKKAGFDRPILHGLCTYGFVARALLDHCCASDPSRFRSMSARFASPVYPGEVLRTEIVETGGDRAAVRAMVDDRVVLDGGTCSYLGRS